MVEFTFVFYRRGGYWKLGINFVIGESEKIPATMETQVTGFIAILPEIAHTHDNQLLT